jgi:ankyrin repeat protein
MRTAVIVVFTLLLLATLPAAAAAGDHPEFFEAIEARDLAAVTSSLDGDPSLVNAQRANGTSAVTTALFAIGKGERGFHPVAKNDILQALLARSPKLNVFDTAALGTAAELDALLRHDPKNIHYRSAFGWTLLHVAAFAGNTGTTELLLNKGAPIEARAESRFRNTPLQTALLTGELATAKLLLDRGADALVRQHKGSTPMHEAALLGRQDLVQLLLDHGAELNSVSDNGQTPLAEALRGGHTELAEWMKAKGAVGAIQSDEDVDVTKKKAEQEKRGNR